MIIYGKQIFLYILDNYPHFIEEIYLAKEIDKKIFSRVVKLRKPIIKLDGKKAQAMSHGGNHQGFFLKIQDVAFTPFKSIKNSSFLLVLYGVTDVGNIGAMTRSAYALGVDAIVIAGLKSFPMEKLVRSSSGAIFEMPITLFSDGLTLINELKQIGFTTYAAVMDGEDVNKITFSDRKALVMGSEGEGLPSKIINKCDVKVTIKMQRKFDSLNVSAATAILCDRMR